MDPGTDSNDAELEPDRAGGYAEACPDAERHQPGRISHHKSDEHSLDRNGKQYLFHVEADAADHQYDLQGNADDSYNGNGSHEEYHC